MNVTHHKMTIEEIRVDDQLVGSIVPIPRPGMNRIFQYLPDVHRSHLGDCLKKHFEHRTWDNRDVAVKEVLEDIRRYQRDHGRCDGKPHNWRTGE